MGDSSTIELHKLLSSTPKEEIEDYNILATK